MYHPDKVDKKKKIENPAFVKSTVSACVALNIYE